MKFKQKLERSLSLRFSTDRKKNLCNYGNKIADNELSGNPKKTYYQHSETELDSKLSNEKTENMKYCNKDETCQSLLHLGNISNGPKCHCHLSKDLNNKSAEECTASELKNEKKCNLSAKFLHICENFPLEFESKSSRNLFSFQTKTERKRKKGGGIFKRSFTKTRKKVKFVKNVLNTKNVAIFPDRNLSGNVKPHILKNMTEIINISKYSGIQTSNEGNLFILKEIKQESTGKFKQGCEHTKDFSERSKLHLDLENRDNKDMQSNVPKNRTHDLNSEGFSCRISKDLSPTCADIYGIDEVDDVSFHKLDAERDSTHVLEVKLGNVTIEKEVNSTYDKLGIDSQNAQDSNQELNEISELKSEKCVPNQEADKLLENEIKSKSKKQISDKKGNLNKFYSFRQTSSNSILNSAAKQHESYENPWVLQDHVEYSPSKTLNHTNVEIESSLGFEVNSANPEEIKTADSAIVRSSSLESVDSFGSSYHSVNSVQDLYFSDSEAEHNLNDITDDTTEVPEDPDKGTVSIFKVESNHENNLEEKATRNTTGHPPKHIRKLNKRSRRPFSMDSFPKELDSPGKERNMSSDSDSDLRQMIPYTLAESFSGNVTDRKKKKRLHSRSFDGKLDKSALESSDKHVTGTKSNLVKSISLGIPGENETKSEAKEKHFRRSLDSSLAQRNILNELQSPEQRKSLISDTNEFLSPVQESDAKASKTDKAEEGVVEKHFDPKWYFTLPNPKKMKSQQKVLKKKMSRLGSVSKLLSDKASSLSSLKMEASFKLRKELEKSKELVSSSATSFSDLMSKKASSFSTLIRRRTNSNTVTESPFKQYTKKKNKAKDEDDSELVYEKVLVRVPIKRPVTALEQTARTKMLKVNLKLAKSACKSESEKYNIDSRSRTNSFIGRPWSSGSISPLKSPTLLDEIMKSVDTAGVRKQCSVSNDDIDPSDCEESSSGSSLFLFQKQYSLDSDTNLVKDSTMLTVCRVCGKVRNGSEKISDSIDSLLLKRYSGPYKISLSLCDLTSSCQCMQQNTRNRFSVVLPVADSSTHKSDLSAKRRSWDIISDFKELGLGEIKGGNVVRKRKTAVPICQRPSSMFDLRSGHDDIKETVEFEVGDSDDKDSIDGSSVLPGTLLRHKPLLDLSGENLDETVDSQDDDIVPEDSYTKKSQSCGDLLDSGRYSETEAPQLNSVMTKVKNKNDEETEIFHSCSEIAETEFTFEENSDKQKSHSCCNLLDVDEETLKHNLKLEEQRKKELRKVKVKSMSSSHDALSILGPMEDIDINEIDGYVAAGRGDKKNSESDRKDTENGQSIVNNIIELTQNGLDVGVEVGEEQISTDFKTDVVNEVKRTSVTEDDKENTKCLKCKHLRTESSENFEFNSSGNVVPRKVISKPPLPSKRRRAKVLSLTDISNHDDVDYKCLRRQKGYSMVELNKENVNVCKCDIDLKNRKTNSQRSSSFDKFKLTSTPKSSSLRSPVKKFLFEEHQVQKYIQNVSKLERQKSVSSDNIKIGSLESPQQLGSDSLHSASSLNRLSKDSWSDDVFNRLSFPLAPQLSPYVDFLESTPVKGFSRLSGPRITSPGFLPELPELPSLTEECVYKYDVCLGYLLHSVQCDNKMICVYSLQRNKQLMESVITPLTASPPAPRRKQQEHGSSNKNKAQHKTKLEEFPNPAAPITNVPSDRLAHAGLVLRTVLLARAPHMIRDRKFHLRTYRRCMVGTEMVDWLLQQSALVHSRTQAVGMWQALVEEGVVVHVCHEHQFKDKYLFYRFHEDDEGASTVPSSSTKRECEEDLPDVFLMLAHIGPDAMMRMILRKPPHERTSEDLEIIYEELLHIKALSHLSTMVKRELASVLLFESHAKSGTVLFNQGDEGKSWYIILKGSVNVVIYGKGVVCTLHEGDDFGKLALVNDAPRAATIVLRDDNCHFLRVDKDDFNRILRDVEANTVRLKEHGQDVLVLEKIPSNTQTADGTVQAHYKYSVMAGTPEKMLEHLLDSRLDNKNETEIDGFLEDFLLTHVIYMPCNHLCPVLLSHYHSSTADTTEQEGFEFMLNHKKCVLHFVQEWANIVGVAFKEDHTINAFLEELHSCIQDDLEDYTTLKDDLVALETILNAHAGSPSNKTKKRMSGTFTFSRKHSKDCFQDFPKKKKPICPSDETIFKVYCADHTYSTLKLPMDTKVEQLLLSTKEKLGLGDDLILCEVKSTGERLIFKENDLCVTTGLSINGQLFVTPKEHLDALTPIPEQEGLGEGSFSTIEMFSSREMAYHMTQYDWELFTCVQEYELIYQVFGRYKFGKITANLDLFLRRFNEIQFWIVTEMVLTNNLSKRVSLLRKFIKLAAHCKEFRNLNSFFAIVMGLSNIAVSRLSQTWEKLPSKFKKMFADFETLMDPSRNHRVYRLSVAKMLPPIIPFMPLLMKDMTFTHEGNKTYFDGLVNFEKMHMIAQTLKTVRFCRSARLDIEAPGTLKSSDTSEYIRSIKVIDNQRLLTQLSHKLEPRKT